MNPADWSGIVYAYFFVGTGILYGIGRIIQHGIGSLIYRALEPVCDDLQKIKYQLYNNGGESMRDAIDRIESDAVELKINQAIIKTKLDI